MLPVGIYSRMLRQQLAFTYRQKLRAPPLQIVLLNPRILLANIQPSEFIQLHLNTQACILYALRISQAQLVLAMEQLQQREEQAASRSKLSTPSQPHTPSGDVERAISWCTREAQEAAATVAVSQHALEATSPVAHEEDRQGATFKSTSVAAAGAATTSVPAPALPQATASAPPASP
eukprot:scaffold156042_cov23-Tisochrysis_lutea.AAC.1